MAENEEKCYWLDEMNICCNPFQDKPYQAKCPAVLSACGGYASSARDAVSNTRVTIDPKGFTFSL